MPRNQWEMDLLIKVLEDLEDFLPHLVLVGGWVPYLYAHFLWKGIPHDPLMTVDIDFGLREGPYKGKKTITDRVIEKKYGEHHVRLGHDFPFVPIVKIKNKSLRADVEFISPPNVSSQVRNRLVGTGILINEIEDFDVLLKDTMKINVMGFKVFVPKPPTFVFHKLLTFPQRRGLEKRQKDLHHVYYVLLYSPEKKQIKSEIQFLMERHRKGDQVRKNVKSFFKHSNDKGPVWIAEGAKTTMVSDLVSDIREDAYNRLRSLLPS